MKTLGILGGMSWESTATYYRLLNETVRTRCGGLHSAPILLHSVDFAGIREMQIQGDWDAAGAELGRLATGLEHAGAEIMLIATNTMHKVADAVERAISIPLLHIVDPTAAALKAAGIRTVALLGTGYTMEQDFYRGRLETRFGIEVLTPDADDRALIDTVIFNELCLGRIEASSRKVFQRVMGTLHTRGAQGVILGCTEIGLLIAPNDAPFPVFDTTVLHAEAAATLALEA